MVKIKCGEKELIAQEVLMKSMLFGYKTSEYGRDGKIVKHL